MIATRNDGQELTIQESKKVNIEDPHNQSTNCVGVNWYKISKQWAISIYVKRKT